MCRSMSSSGKSYRPPITNMNTYLPSLIYGSTTFTSEMPNKFQQGEQQNFPTFAEKIVLTDDTSNRCL